LFKGVPGISTFRKHPFTSATRRKKEIGQITATNSLGEIHLRMRKVQMRGQTTDILPSDQSRMSIPIWICFASVLCFVGIRISCLTYYFFPLKKKTVRRRVRYLYDNDNRAISLTTVVAYKLGAQCELKHYIFRDLRIRPFPYATVPDTNAQRRDVCLFIDYFSTENNLFAYVCYYITHYTYVRFYRVQPLFMNRDDTMVCIPPTRIRRNTHV